MKSETFDSVFKALGIEHGVRWHYLAAYRDHPGGERTYSICAVYIDGENRLEYWTENPAMTPTGYDLGELIDDLRHMLDDACAYEPVAFDELRLAMEIRRRGA